MMTNQHLLTLVDPTTGKTVFRCFPITDNSEFGDIQRLPLYSLIWLREATGTLQSDFTEYLLKKLMLLSFSPYQPFRLCTNGKITGQVIQFHPDFFCIHKHQQEVACNGLLFNNIYQPPFVDISIESADRFDQLIEQMKFEMRQPALAQYELLVSYLKIFLINASRAKAEQETQFPKQTIHAKEPFILQNLKTYIEQHFKTKHAPGEYAALLHISTRALAKLTKNHFHKTLTDLISERIVIEAKRELYLTNKSVKEIAYELGYEDEYYFSRFFKNNAEVSPQNYRETVGYARAI